jgi:hypothetical protein
MWSTLRRFLFEPRPKDLEYQADRDLRLGHPLAIRCRFDFEDALEANERAEILTNLCPGILTWVQKSLFTDIFYVVTAVRYEQDIVVILISRDPDNVVNLGRSKGMGFFSSALSGEIGRLFEKMRFSGLHNLSARFFELPDCLPEEKAIQYLNTISSEECPIFIKLDPQGGPRYRSTLDANWSKVLTWESERSDNEEETAETAETVTTEEISSDERFRKTRDGEMFLTTSHDEIFRIEMKPRMLSLIGSDGEIVPNESDEEANQRMPPLIGSDGEIVPNESDEEAKQRIPEDDDDDVIFPPPSSSFRSFFDQ